MSTYRISRDKQNVREFTFHFNETRTDNKQNTFSIESTAIIEEENYDAAVRLLKEVFGDEILVRLV